MNITRDVNQSGTIAPNALNFLGEIPTQYLHLNHHARRHPLGIYNVSIEQLEKDFGKLLTLYFESFEFYRENVQINGTLIKDNLNEGYVDLLEAQKTLIHSLRSHIDDCYLILASLVNADNLLDKPTNIIFTEKWLKSIEFPSLDSFNNAISFYKNKYLSALVNGMKHKQCRLRGLFFYKYADVRLGYYLEEPGTDGIPGPSPNVHKDRNSAFSFAKDILFNLYHVFFISVKLTEAVKVALKEFHSFDLQPVKCDSRNEKWQSLLRKAAGIRSLVFPDEIDKPIACLSFSENEYRASAILRYPVVIISPSFPQGMKIMSTIHLDGVGMTYKLPYLQDSSHGAVR